MHGRVPLGDAGSGRLDLRAVGDVADLGLGAELACDTLQPLGSAGEEDAAPAARGQEPRGGGSDPARSSGYDGDANGRNSRLPAL